LSTLAKAETAVPASWLQHIPNLITLFRIALIPVLAALLMQPGELRALLAAATFFLASWSDYLDGYLARRWNLSTNLGRILDPLADKLLVATALIMLVSLERQPAVPAWMAVVVIGRELAVTGLRAVALSRGYVHAAEELGKYKMVFQVLAMHGLLLHYDFVGINFHIAGMYFLWIALVLGLWSGVVYHYQVIGALMRSEHNGEHENGEQNAGVPRGENS